MGVSSLPKGVIKSDMMLLLPGYIGNCAANIMSRFAKTGMSMSHQLPLSQYGVEIIWNLEVKAKSELNNEHPDIIVELKKLKK